MNIKEIIESQVLLYFGMEREEIHTKCRKRKLCDKRHIAMYIMLKYKVGTDEAAKYFGYANHTSSLSAKKKVKDIMCVDFNFKNQIIEIMEIIKTTIK